MRLSKTIFRSRRMRATKALEKRPREAMMKAVKTHRTICSSKRMARERAERAVL